jgi:hypothetical protein
MEEVLMELPFGEKFRQRWGDCVEFYRCYNRDVRISSQNSVLRTILNKCSNEEDAIKWVDDFCEMVIKYPTSTQKKIC